MWEHHKHPAQLTDGSRTEHGHNSPPASHLWVAPSRGLEQAGQQGRSETAVGGCPELCFLTATETQGARSVCLAQVLPHSQQAQSIGWPYLSGKMERKNGRGGYLSLVAFEGSMGQRLTDFYIELIL